MVVGCVDRVLEAWPELRSFQLSSTLTGDDVMRASKHIHMVRQKIKYSVSKLHVLTQQIFY